MLTVREAAHRAGLSPETIRRWIRDGKLRSSKVGARYVIDEVELAGVVQPYMEESLPLPEAWRTTFWGEPMPNVVRALRRSREGR